MLRSETQQSESRVYTPSFIDLRRFARDIDTGEWSVSHAGQDAFLNNRRRLALPDGPVEVGAIHLDIGQGSVEHLSADEFVIICEGSVSFHQADGQLELGDSASVLLPHGAAFNWRCHSPSTLIYIRYKDSVAGDGKMVGINESAPLVPSGSPLAELLIGPTPQCRNHTDYLSADGEFMCGTWDSTPYHRRAMKYRHFELMYLLEGSVTFVDEVGAEGTFTKGDIFMVEQQAQCSWDSQVYVKKVYAIFRPA